MDSRIREALEYVFGYNAKGEAVPDMRPIMEALALLTAEPEPCEDARVIAGKVQGCNHDSAECVMLPFDDAVALIDAYASRLAQEARADERIQSIDAARAEWFRDTKTISFSRIERAILQGTEPAKVSEDVFVLIEEIKRVSESPYLVRELSDRLVARLNGVKA